MRISRVFIAALTMLAVTFGAWAEGQGEGAMTEGPVPVSVFVVQHPDDLFSNDDNWTQAVNEMLGIVIDWIPAPQDVRDERIATMMASGDLPDVVNIFDPGVANIYGAQGAFLKMDPLIEEYGPDMTELLDKSLTAAYRDAAGDLYGAIGMHYGGGAPGCGQSLNYRTDTMAELGLTEPDTPDGWMEAWRAFKAQNTGPGVALSGRSSYRTLMQAFTSAFGLTTKTGSLRELVTYTDLQNHTEFEFLPATDEYRDLLMFAHQIYAEGLTNVDIFTRDHSQWWPDVVAGHDFTWADCFSRSSYARINAAEGGVTIAVEGATTPMDANGNRTWYKTTPLMVKQQTYSIAADSKVVPAAMKFLNFWFSKPGVATRTFGLECPDAAACKQAVEDGKKALEAGEEVPLSPGNWWREGGEYFVVLDEQIARVWTEVDQGKPNYLPTKVFRDYPDVWKAISPSWWETHDAVEKNWPHVVVLPLFNIRDTDASEEAANLAVELNLYKEEWSTKFITGDASFDQWDEYVAGYEALGADRYVEIQQSALDDFLMMVGG